MAVLRRSNSLRASTSVAVATTTAPRNTNGKPREEDQDVIQAEATENRILTDELVIDEHGSANSQLATSREHSVSQQKLSPTSIALIMLPLCLSVLLSALDLTIVTPAIPSIVASFQSSVGYVWIGSAFVLANTAFTPVWGSVADIWGRKPIMLIAILLFLAGSLLCALSPHMDALIAGRAVQGVGASGMGTMVNVIICDTFSLRDRGLYLAITSMFWAVGSAVGPILGGVFTTRLTWRWCFWINLPIGAVVFFVLLFFLNITTPHTPVLAGLKAIDWPGSLLIIGGALMILFGLESGGVSYPWSSTTIICLIVFGAVAVGIFLVNEWKFAANPIIPLRLFSSISAAAAYGVFTSIFYVYIGLAYYLPLYSQAVLGANALTSGVYLLPLIVSCSLAAAFGGVFIQRTGKYVPLMYAAEVTLVLGAGLFLDLKFEQNLSKLFVFEIIAGVGVGLNIEAPILAAQAATTVRDTAAVISTMGFLRSLGTAISIVVSGVIFQNEMTAANPHLVEQIGPELAKQFNGDQASANVELIGALNSEQQAIVRKVYFESMRAVWIMYVAFAGVSAVLSLFVRAHFLNTKAESAVLGANRKQTAT
ncbi:major facilitator superfamily-domain-containing protein [Annulohypoxylon maeteangense]|uniref:major facilitator superfamily-domain-containing protein n=1 Tax=Annulohypoxylon maeteangense TaxID=1927788 RepID=UPI0020083E31|nr:major facilitator superfamily-domain-containing protein [Annulohypoxylon maeteangense]KAI0889574.1 major facilitator superfamily-domain-containing protein [Annulohypoxylon maeteangense]